MQWFETKQIDKSEKTQQTDLKRIKSYILAEGLGAKKFTDVTFNDLKKIIRKLENRGAYDMASVSTLS